LHSTQEKRGEVLLCEEVAGCAIMLASSSLMRQAEAILEQFRRMLAGDDFPSIDDLGDLAAFEGVGGESG
jgi:NifU-like protein involved in Fe-S cluster formation